MNCGSNYISRDCREKNVYLIYIDDNIIIIGSLDNKGPIPANKNEKQSYLIKTLKNIILSHVIVRIFIIYII